MTPSTPCKAPPLGLRPRFIADERRSIEIVEAMTRYVERCRPMPEEWLSELAEINKRLSDRQKHAPVDELSAAPPREDAGVGPCKWVARIPKESGKSAAEIAMRVEFKSARETLMQAYGASPSTIREVIDPFDSVPPPDWYETVKLTAVRYKEQHGTVRTKHLLAVGAGVQSIQELRFISDGPKRGAAFVALLEADLMIREATGKAIDVKAMTTDDDLI